MSKTTVSTPKAHALLGASSAARWLACSPSARMCEDIPETESPYAAEGTLAHEICELKLTKAYTERPPMQKRRSVYGLLR